MTCIPTRRPDDGEGLGDPDDYDQLELMQIGENTVPILSEKIMPHWADERDHGGDGEMFHCTIAIEAIGRAHPSYPAMVVGVFDLPNRGDVLECRDPDGREFVGRLVGMKIEEGHLDLGFDVLEPDDDEVTER